MIRFAEAGEAIYFPSMFYHATLNIGEECVFISTFVDDSRPHAQPLPPDTKLPGEKDAEIQLDLFADDDVL